MSLSARIKYLLGHAFVRQSAVLQAGTVLGTLIQAVSGVVIARVLKPELFGQYSVAFSIASIVTVLLGAGVQDAVAPYAARAWATSDQSGLRRALGFWAKFTLANIVATLAVVLILPLVVSGIYHDGNLGFYAVIIIIASLISTTVFTLAQLMLQIAGRIAALSVLTLVDVVARYGAVIGLALAGLGIYGAVSGHLLGALAVFLVSIVVYGGLARSLPILPSFSDFPSLVATTPFKPLIGPTLWVMADRNLGMLYGALPVAMVGLYATGTEVAYFKLAFGYLMLAMTALGPISTLLNVHFPTVQVTNAERLKAAFIKVTSYSMLMTFGITAVIIAVSPWVFRLLYGPLYLPSIPYVYGLGVFGALFGLGVGLGPMWRAVNRVRVSIFINLCTLGVGVPLGIFMIHRWNTWGAVAMVTLWYTVSHVASFVFLVRILNSPAKEGNL